MVDTQVGERFLTPLEAAQLLHITRAGLYGKIHAGELDVLRLGDGPKAPMRIAPADLVAYLREANRGEHVAHTQRDRR